MRIISGKYRGRSIFAPTNLPVRPTTDFAKEGLFNILNNLISIQDSSFLDLFSGTGNISYELGSRDAKRVISVDRNYYCNSFQKKTIGEMQLQQVIALKYDVFKYLKKCTEQFDVIFADPPYDMKNIDEIHHLVMSNNLLPDTGYLIIEHGKQTDLSNLEWFLSSRKFGNVNFSIFSKTKQ